MTRQIDCNECLNINITEEQQRRLGNALNHVCMKFHKRVLHGVCKPNSPHFRINPCKECRGEHFTRE